MWLEIKMNDIKKRQGERKRLSTPRITPKVLPDWSEYSKKLLIETFNLSDITDIYSLDPPEMNEKTSPIYGPVLLEMHSNIVHTFDRFPEHQIADRNYFDTITELHSLNIRERELLIIRTAWLNRSEYVFTNHTAFWVLNGLNFEEINLIIEGPDAPGWNPEDALLLRVADNLYEDAFIADKLWDHLSKRYSTDQIAGIILLVGHYTVIAMITNSFGVQIERRSKGFGEFSAKLAQRTKKIEQEGGVTFPIVREKMNLFYLDAVRKNSE